MKLWKPKVYEEEVAHYIRDLRDMTELREKSEDADEKERYTNTIELMQLTLERLLERGKG